MDLIVDEVGEIVVNNVHVGAGAQASRTRRTAGRSGSARSASARSTSASSATRSAPLLAAVQPAERAAARRGRRRGRQRPRPAGADGRGRQRRQRRRRHRAHPRGRPRGRPARRDDLAARSARWRKARRTPLQLAPRRATTERDDVDLPARHAGVGLRRGVLVQRRRRDLRPRAAAGPGTSSRRRTRIVLPAAAGRARPTRASRGARPRRRPGTGCRRRARSSGRRPGGVRCAG